MTKLSSPPSLHCCLVVNRPFILFYKYTSHLSELYSSPVSHTASARARERERDGEKVLLQGFTAFCGAGDNGMQQRWIEYSVQSCNLERSRVLPPLKFSIFSRIVLLGFIGCSSQIMGYTGISYSSPTLSSAISNLVPAFTFLLAIVFRMEKIALKSTSCRAKILGTIVSISGAFVVTLYKGQPIIIAHAPSFSLHQPLGILKSVDRSWAIGGLLLTAEYILVPLWYVVQVQIMRVYPDELTVVFFYNLCVSIMAAVVGIFTEPNPSAWKIEPNTAFVSILCSGIFGSFLNNTIHTWALRIKGPLYVAMFKPLSIVIAVALGFIFLGDTLYLGSLIGATIISIGFYTVMWGKSTEEVGGNIGRVESPTAENVPLLQGYENEGAEKKMHASV